VARAKRVLSGMRPTGRLHIGHFFGALENWVKLQEEYDCYFFVADWHALTTDYADTSQVAQNSIEIGTDWLAAGLDPEKCTLFVQSQVPEHAELHLLLSMVTPLSWLERVPTYKEQLEQIRDKDLHTYGFLGYPLLQSADIVLYGEPRAELFVPVGEDQVPHVELTREIVRRFNTYFGFKVKDALFHSENEDSLRKALSASGVFLGSTVKLEYPLKSGERVYFRSRIRRAAAEAGVANFFEINPGLREWFLYREKRLSLCEPDVLLTETPRLPGTDGRKMSKSYGNYIELGESDESIRAKTKVMMTDPARKRRTDPGNPDVCPVFSWHKLFSTPETIAWSDQGCRTAGIGCIECKAAMADHLIKWIAPIRARRTEYAAHPERVREILAAGSKKAQRVARKTMRRVREAIFGAAPKAAAKRAASPQVAGS
jgi:tryptophanyl-tRNA synthetase